MKKWRFSLIVIGAILIAPPLGGFCAWIEDGLLFPHSELMGPAFSIYHLQNSYLPCSYIFGLIPSLTVAIYGAWKVIKHKPLYKWRAYFIGLVLAYANYVVVTSVDNLLSYRLLIWMLAVVTPTFFMLYFVVKKLLPWARTSLIEPIKAGTP